MKPTPGTLAILSLVVAGAVGAAVWLAGMAQDCHTRWHRSGFAYEWRDHTCFVQAGSRWLPERAVRVHVREPGATDRLATP
jgi:hypothetical protein